MDLNLTLILTERCNAKCKHCFEENCNYTSKKSDMKISDAERFINEVIEISKEENKKVSVHFSGGEVFLVYNTLIHLTKYAKNKGVTSISCTTNGYWGKSEKEADKKIKELASAGLTLIGISLDDFHQQHIKLQYVRSAIKTVQKHGIRFAIKTVATKTSKRLPDVLQDISDLLLNKSFVCQEIPYIPYNPTSKIPLKEVITEQNLPKDVCPSFVITILPDGIIFPCCSVGWTENLIIGNALTESIVSVWERLKSNIVFEILQDKGPIFFANHMNKTKVADFKEDSFSNYCHLCFHVFKSEKFHNILPNVIHEWKRERVDQIVNILME